MPSHRLLPCLSTVLSPLFLTLLGGCHRQSEQPSSPPGSFNQFVKGVATAKASEFMGKPEVEVESEAAFEEMKKELVARARQGYVQPTALASWFLSEPGSSPARARIQQLRRLSVRQRSKYKG